MKVAFLEEAPRGGSEQSCIASLLMKITFERMWEWPKSKALTKEPAFQEPPATILGVQ